MAFYFSFNESTHSSKSVVTWSVEFDDSVLSSAQPTTSESSTTNLHKKILLVSAFYPLEKSKHTDAEYTAWLQRFLGHVSTDIYFFTTPELEPFVRNARDALPFNASTSSSSQNSYIPQLIINTTYPSPSSIPPLLPHKAQYEQMHAWDREKERHGPELYAIWNAKPWFLREGLRNMKVHDSDDDYDYAFWTDAGSFRHEHAYETWPDVVRVEEVWESGFQLQRDQWKAWDAMRDSMPEDHVGRDREKERKAQVTSKEDLIFFPVYELPGKKELGWKEALGPIDIDFSEGELFKALHLLLRFITQLLTHRNVLRLLAQNDIMVYRSILRVPRSLHLYPTPLKRPHTYPPTRPSITQHHTIRTPALPLCRERPNHHQRTPLPLPTPLHNRALPFTPPLPSLLKLSQSRKLDMDSKDDRNDHER
jgi:hypothetical protein